MRRSSWAVLVLAAAVSGVGIASAEQTEADREIAQVAHPSPEQLDKVYGAALAEMAAKLGAADLKQQEEGQKTLEAMADNAAAPGHEAQRLAFCKQLIGYLDAKHPRAVRYWSIRALETAGRNEVIDALAGLLKDPDPQIRERALAALINNPGAPQSKGTDSPAGRAAPPKSAKTAALVQTVRTATPAQAAAAIDAGLRSTDEWMQIQAASLVGSLPDAEVVKLLDAPREDLSWKAKVVFLFALADHQKPAALDLAMLFATSDSLELADAGVEVLGKVGGAGAVPILVQDAAEGTGHFQSLARESLTRLKGNDLDQALIAQLSQSNPRQRAEIARALGVRRMPPAIPALLDLAAKDADPAVRVQAIEALGAAGGPQQLDPLLAILSAPQTDEEGKAAETAVGQIIYRIHDADQRAEPLLRTMQAHPGTRLALIGLLGRTGSGRALDVLRQSLASNEEPTRLAALRSLSEWPGGAVADDLLGFARQSKNEKERVLALRGYIRALQLPPDRSDEQLVKAYAEAIPLARPEEKRSILAGLGNVPTADSLRLVAPMLDDEAVRNEAVNAALKIARGMGTTDPDLLRSTMAKVEAATPELRFKQSAREIVRKLDEAGK